MRVAQHWRLNNQRYMMNAVVDNEGRVNFPPRPKIQQRQDERYEIAVSTETAQQNQHIKKTESSFVSVA
ncbi:MAG: hypothetical protein CUN55_10430 [Phototrophicales bacterium]|nr:MAG: hypothetical protein CUN55_10430 [Phototrophicales bacterium]